MRKIKIVKPTDGFDIGLHIPALRDHCRDHGIELLYHFGGSAGESRSPLSDLDLAYYAKETPDPLILQNDFARLLKRDDLDLVDLKLAPPPLAYRAIKEGKLIFCSDEALRVRFEYLAVARYLSTAHLRNEFHRDLRRTIEKGGFYRHD